MKTIVSIFMALFLGALGGMFISTAAEEFFQASLHPAIPTAIIGGFNVATLFIQQGSSLAGFLPINFGFQSMLAPDQQENPAGLQVIGYMIPLADLDQPIPSLVPLAQANNNTLATTLQGNFTPKQGKAFFEIYNTMDTGGIDSNAVGELDGKSFEHILDGFIPGQSEDLEAFARKVINTRWIAIRLTVDGKRKVIGSPEFPALVSELAHTTGRATADRRGLTFQLKSRGLGPAPFYNGPIPLSATTVPPVGT